MMRRGGQFGVRNAAGGRVWPRLEILLIYEDSSAESRARRVFERVKDQVEFEVALGLTMWSFDLFREPAMLERALRVAFFADLVLLAARGDAEPPAGLKLWLSRWLACAESRPRVLAVSLAIDPGGTLELGRSWKSLSTEAQTAGVHVLLHQEQARLVESDAGADAFPFDRTGTRCTVLGEFPDRFGRFPSREGGINE